MQIKPPRLICNLPRRDAWLSNGMRHLIGYEGHHKPKSRGYSDKRNSDVGVMDPMGVGRRVQSPRISKSNFPFQLAQSVGSLACRGAHLSRGKLCECEKIFGPVQEVR